MTAHAPLEILQKQAGDVAQRLRILAHPDRLIMLCRMSEGEVSVGELVDLTRLPQSSVSQHLAMLRDAGAVEARAEAQSRLYRITDAQVTAIIGALCAACGPGAA
ncbi:metalloregulator ArsR/SmtB family transcription factor [Sphingomonas sp.]|uniref:ArsR/SmtB family transcription factor n=1 Tax=Sphingomonas sp. TaxID=28214 RepID=UPI001EB241AC|nr:metalloregulator ArsR/SmtB family transcription factor [Sphingomonas sp.]MBX3593350.1 helix-turn-helix transcriptional regulator [Sphingomonas sp.]